MKTKIQSAATRTEPATNSNTGGTRLQWIIALVSNFTVFNLGVHTGWVASVALLLQSDQSPLGYSLTNIHISWLASAICLGALISIPVWIALVDRCGRKPCIIACAVLQTISWIVKYCYADIPGYVIARVIAGIGSGGCVYVYPMYIKEISQDDLRGTLGMIFNLARSAGILGMYLMGYVSYNTILITVTILSVISVITLVKTPETPTYYIKTGNVDAAASTLALLRSSSVDSKVVQNALDLIKAEDEKFRSIPNVTFFGIFKQKAWRKGFILMILLMTFHSLNGGFVIVNYAQTILNKFGASINPQLLSLSVPIMMMIGSLLSMVFIERLGRKPILMMSFLVSALTFAGLGVLLLILQQGGTFPAWVPVALIVVPVFTYAAAVSPIPYVIMSEMFNFQIRAKVMGCLVIIGWTGAFTQLLAFGPVVVHFGLHVVFFASAVINVFGTLVVLILLPETKMKTVEQIEQELER